MTYLTFLEYLSPKHSLSTLTVCVQPPPTMGSGHDTQMDRGGNEGSPPCTTCSRKPAACFHWLCFITVITADETLRKCKLGKSIDNIAGAWFKTIKESWIAMIPPVIREMGVGNQTSIFTERD